MSACAGHCNRYFAANRRFIARAIRPGVNRALGARSMWGWVMSEFERCVAKLSRSRDHAEGVMALRWAFCALEALAAERAAERSKPPAWEEELRARSIRYKAQGNPPFRLVLDGRG
jgi:hypothetical protein